MTGIDSALVRQRDDGPLRLVLRPGRRPVPPAAAALAGVAPWLVVLGLAGHSGWRLPVGIALAWLIVAGAASGLRPADGRLCWVVAPALHLAEYAGLARLAALAGASSLDTAYALVAVVVVHHYDLTYRAGGPAQRLAGVMAGGWAGRLLFGYAAAAGGVVRPAFAAAALVAFGVFAGEAAVTWKDAAHRDRVSVADVEEPL